MSTSTLSASNPVRSMVQTMDQGITKLQGIFRGRTVRSKYAAARAVERCILCNGSFDPTQVHAQKKEVITSCFHRMHLQCLRRSILETGKKNCPTCEATDPLSEPPFQPTERMKDLEADIKYLEELNRIANEMFQNRVEQGKTFNKMLYMNRSDFRMYALSCLFLSMTSIGTYFFLNSERISEQIEESLTNFPDRFNFELPLLRSIAAALLLFVTYQTYKNFNFSK